MTNQDRFKQAETWLSSRYGDDYGPNDPVSAIREALAMAQSGMCLPVLPEGYIYTTFSISNHPGHDGEINTFAHTYIDGRCIGDMDMGIGLTPYASAVNALERIGK